MGPATKRQLVKELVCEQGVSVSRACKIVSFPRSQFYYSSKRDDRELVVAIQDLAFKFPSYGFRKLFIYLRRAGYSWNHKKVRRVYLLLKLNKRRKGKRRLPARVKQPLQPQTQINKSWSMDFMSDSMTGGRKFRTFNVMDDCSREALAIEIDTSLSAQRIVRVLDRIIQHRGKPASIRVDNGPEFTSSHFMSWCEANQIQINYTQPGRPMQNGFIERFNRLYREAVLDAYLFFELDQVRELTTEWLEEYNLRRPHESLQNLTPEEWKQRTFKKENYI